MTPAANRRVALLVVHTNSYFANLLPVARLIARSNAFVPRILFTLPYPTRARDEATCRAEGFAFEVLPPLGRIRRSLRARLSGNPALATARLVATIRRMRATIRELDVALVILPADNRYDLAAYVRAAHDDNVPVVVVPAFMAAAREWAQAVGGNPSHDAERWRNRATLAVYPRWGLEHDGRSLIALPAEEVLARQWLGLAPPLPWTLHSGHADAIAIESEAMRHYCLSEGLPARQLVLTGSVDHDRLHARLRDAEALREATYHRLGLPSGRPLVLTALPPDQLYGRGRPECDFQNYRELVKFWIGSIVARTPGHNVIVSLHPSVERQSMSYLEQWGATIADEPVSELIPLCDLYIASVSATIQWAIACGKPVLDYDVYRYRYPDYLGVGGLIRVEEQVDWLAALERFACDEAFRVGLVARQAHDAPRWGVLDGHAGDRLLALFRELAFGE